MSRGFHAFFRQYYNLRALLRRADPGLARLVPLADYPLVDAQGRRDSFRGLPRTPPWNALAFALRSPTFRPRDLLALNARGRRAAGRGVRARHLPTSSTRWTRRRSCAEINFPAAARHLAFEVFSRSFFAAPGADVGGRAGRDVPHLLPRLQRGPGVRRARRRVRRGPLGPAARATWPASAPRSAPAADGSQRGARAGPGRLPACTRAGGPLDADGVVLATDVAGLRAHRRRRSPASGRPGLARQVGRAAHRAAVPGPAAVAGPAGRPGPPGVPGHRRPDPLDNISVLDRYDSQARDWAAAAAAARWSNCTPTPRPATRPPRRAGDVARLHDLYPETGAARGGGRVRAVARGLPDVRRR